MGKTLHIGNLSRFVASIDLQELFSPHGTVTSARVILDRTRGYDGRFGFVEMAHADEAARAIAALHGEELDGRRMAVSLAVARMRL